MRLIDSIKLGAYKFRVARIRSIFAGCAIAMAVWLIGVILVIGAGIVGFYNNFVKDSLDGRFFARIYVAITQNDLTAAISEYKQDHRDYPIVKITPITVINRAVRFNPQAGLVTLIDSDPGQVSSQDFEFWQDFVLDTEPITTWQPGKPIPVLIALSRISDLDGPQGPIAATKQGNDVRSAVKAVVGKTYKLNWQQYNVVNNRNTETNYQIGEVRIVGVYNDRSIMPNGNYLDGDMIMLPAALNYLVSEVQASRQPITLKFSYQLMVELESALARTALTVMHAGIDNGNAEHYEVQFTLPILGKTEIIDTVLSYIQDVVKWIGIIMFTIAGMFVMSTAGKIASESMKEVGILRALGATHWKVAKVFYGYLFLIVTVGFGIGLVLAYATAIFLSLKYGEDLMTVLQVVSTNLQTTPGSLWMVGLPVLPFAAVYLAALITGCIAGAIPTWRVARISPAVAVKRDY
jgi:hypothetical protein